MKSLSQKIHEAVQRQNKAEALMAKAKDMQKYNKAVMAFDEADEQLKALYAEIDRLETQSKES